VTSKITPLKVTFCRSIGTEWSRTIGKTSVFGGTRNAMLSPVWVKLEIGILLLEI
jgi:hypothetical protein